MVKRPSPTGIAFAALFLVFCACSAFVFFRGEGQALDIIVYITFPFSWLIQWLAISVQSPLNLSDSVVNWIMVSLDMAIGTLEIYFFGWILERPFRR